jgi:AcrR family transcriptional regulator
VNPKVTDERKHATRERILQSAQELFSEKGFHGTSMDDIVEKSGMSKGAIYGHFESKDALIMAARQWKQRVYLDGLKSRFSPDDSAFTRLMKMYRDIFPSPDEDSGETCCTEEECIELYRINLEFLIHASRTESLRGGAEDIAITGHRFVGDIVNDGVKDGEFRDDVNPEAVTAILDAILDGLAFHMAVGKKMDWKEVDDTLAKLIEEGLISKNGGK